MDYKVRSTAVKLDGGLVFEFQVAYFCGNLKNGMRKIFISICIFVPVNIYAQTIEDLDPITIPATRKPQKIRETGRSISVIDGKMFQQLPVNSIDELLKYVPGVEVQSRGPMGAQSDIVMRGGTFQQVLVLLDGIKLNDPITGHFSSYIPVAPFEIKRIEVLRGPAAAIYGAEADGQLFFNAKAMELLMVWLCK
jgi:vitamin B12 transporter